MANNDSVKVPAAHWIIAGAALLWNLMGLALYVMGVSTTPEQMAAQYSPQQIALLEAVPAWATSANAIAVNAGVLACVLLLFRKSAAFWLFVVSIAGLMVQDINAFVLQNTIGAFGMVPLYIQITVMAVAIAMVFYTRTATARGLLK